MEAPYSPGMAFGIPESENAIRSLPWTCNTSRF